MHYFIVQPVGHHFKSAYLILPRFHFLCTPQSEAKVEGEFGIEENTKIAEIKTRE